MKKLILLFVMLLGWVVNAQHLGWPKDRVDALLQGVEIDDYGRVVDRETMSRTKHYYNDMTKKLVVMETEIFGDNNYDKIYFDKYEELVGKYGNPIEVNEDDTKAKWLFRDAKNKTQRIKLWRAKDRVWVTHSYNY